MKSSKLSPDKRAKRREYIQLKRRAMRANHFANRPHRSRLHGTYYCEHRSLLV